MAGACLTSCQENNESYLWQNKQAITFSGGINPNDAATRTTGGLYPYWTSGDVVGVFSPQALNAANQPATNEAFTTVVNNQQALFEGEMYWGEGAHDFYAYYPHAEGNTSYKEVAIALPANLQAGGADYDFMVSTPLNSISPNGTLPTTEDVQLQFNHVFVPVEIKIYGSGSLTKVALETEDEQAILAFEGGSIDLSQPKPKKGTPYTINYKGETFNSVTLNLGTPATLGSNESTTSGVVMFINPTDLRNKKITVTVTIDGKETSVSGTGLLFRRGYTYLFTIDLNENRTVSNRLSLLEESIDPTSTVVEYKVTAEQYQLLTSPNYTEPFEAIGQDVYSLFKDDFDFVFYVLNTSDLMASYATGIAGVNVTVSNDVFGLGMDIFSYAGDYGSSGKLKSFMYFPSYDGISFGPALHELCHNWGAYICPTYDSEGAPYWSHWGVSNAGGQLGGFKYVRTVEENSDGVAGKTLYQANMDSDKRDVNGAFIFTYQAPGFGDNANDGNGPAYSDIELYLMGMKSAQELRDANFRLDIYTGCSINWALRSNGYFYATGITSYTIDDIIAMNGPRNPDAAASQKHFKVLTVILTPENAPENHYADIIKSVKWLAGPMDDTTYTEPIDWGVKNFRQATYGRGSLEVDGIKNSLKSAIPTTRGVQTQVAEDGNVSDNRMLIVERQD
jgi:hypothetical protein